MSSLTEREIARLENEIAALRKENAMLRRELGKQQEYIRELENVAALTAAGTQRFTGKKASRALAAGSFFAFPRNVENSHCGGRQADSRQIQGDVQDTAAAVGKSGLIPLIAGSQS